MSSETFAFQAEVQKLLDLMIHSLYSNRDVFLRELVSNASDALDRRRFAGLTDTDLLPEAELAIQLRADPEARTLTIEDNGVGMTRDEVVENIGTVAKSGTSEFLAGLQAGTAGEANPELIGQFGVGFYSGFMVADDIEVVTRKAGSDTATRWQSRGDGSFTIDDALRADAGTTITLRLTEPNEDNDLENYTDEWVLRRIVKKFSDFVAYPIQLAIAGKDAPEGPDEPLNSMKAIWTRPEDEVEEDEYREFYKHISHDWNDYLLKIPAKIEGTFEARALLFVPKVAPFDLYHREMAHRGIQLFVKRVFIMDECRELMPEWLRFVKGVVDSEDLPLNVSREMLQQDKQIKVIRNHLVKKVLDALSDLARDDAERYDDFYTQFGPVLKEGLLSPFDGGAGEKRERVLELARFDSTHHESEKTPLADVVARMADDQDVLYYLTGPSREVLESSPHLEAFRSKGIEVLLLTDPVDEVWLQAPPEFEGKTWQSVGKGEVDLDGDDDEAKQDREQAESDYRDLIASLRAAVQDEVKEVRLSSRLKSSPACLVREQGDVTPQMAEMLRQAGQEAPDVKPILELNPDHPLLPRLREIRASDSDDARLAEYAFLLYGQALLAEGGRLDDPADFSRRVADLMLKALSDPA